MLLFVVGLLFCSTACHTPSQTAAQSKHVDEHEVVIAPDLLTRAPSVTPSFDLELGLGARGDEDAFGELLGIGVDASGRIYALDGFDLTVKVFGRDGSVLHKIGRGGAGPGEFEMPQGLAVWSDTVLVESATVLQEFDTTGRYLTSSRSTPSLPFLILVDHMDSGLIFQRRVRGAQIDNSSMDTVGAYFFRFPAAVDRIFAVPQRMYTYGGVATYPIVLNPGVLISASAQHIYTVAGDSFHIDVWSPQGKAEKAFITRVDRVRATDADLRDFGESTRRNILDVMRANVEIPDYRKTGPVPRFRPVIGAMLGNEYDDLALQRLDMAERPYDLYNDSSNFEWLLLTYAGEPVGRVVLPSRFQPSLFRACAFYGSMRMDDGVDVVRRYPIPPSLCVDGRLKGDRGSSASRALS